MLAVLACVIVQAMGTGVGRALCLGCPASPIGATVAFQHAMSTCCGDGLASMGSHLRHGFQGHDPVSTPDPNCACVDVPLPGPSFATSDASLSALISKPLAAAPQPCTSPRVIPVPAHVSRDLPPPRLLPLARATVLML